MCQRLHHAALGSLRDGAIPLVLGGDHSLGAGSVAAASDWAQQRGQPIGLIWVDAHGDMNTPESSASGNVHGMPLAALLGPEPQELARLAARAPAVDPAHTVLVGIRDLDDAEKANVRRSGVHVFTMTDIDRQGMAAVAEQAIEAARRRARPASTCRSTWTSAIPPSRPASARRCAAASATARRTC